MISIRQAAAQGIEYLRGPKWKLPNDYLKIDILDGSPGPWTHLYTEMDPTPYDILFMDMDYDLEEWLEYKGEIRVASRTITEGRCGEGVNQIPSSR